MALPTRDEVTHPLVRCRRCHGWLPGADAGAVTRGASCPNCQTPLPLSVLVADNNPQLASVIAQLLADEPGFSVLGVVRTGAAAVLAAQKDQPAIVLVDRELGEVSGLALCSALRAVAPDSVLLLWAHEPNRTPAEHNEVDGLIERGMTYRELVDEMRRAQRRTLARGA